MGEKTGIAWTNHTFNPWSGCAKVHAGCANCYAENLPPSMRRGAHWGEVWQGGTRVVASEDYWKEPHKWARAAAKAGERRRVFCASTADVLEVPEAPPYVREAKGTMERIAFERRVLDDTRARLWRTIRETAHVPDANRAGFSGGYWQCGLDWLLLTKRPEHWRLVPEDVRPLVWLGTSVSDQKTADEWVPRLLEVEGFRYRFLSVEPLVGPVDLRRFFSQGVDVWPAHLDWVIVGGESGRKARPCDDEWSLDVVRQCREAGVPCFVKQMGSVMASRWGLKDKVGADPSEWPEELRVHQFPEATP